MGEDIKVDTDKTVTEAPKEDSSSVANQRKKIGRNYIFSMIYQIFALITPLITTPYVSRKLLSDGVGQYSFTFSIVSIFVLFAYLGFATYSQREIARHQGDKHKQSVIFWEVFLLRLIPTAITMLAYIATILIWTIADVYKVLLYIMCINIAAVIFDVNFFFQGNEKFGIIAIRNIIIKIVGTVAVFLIVKQKGDVWKYTLIQSAIVILSNMSLWISLPRVLTKVGIKELHFKRHILPTLKLFIPTIAVSIYTILDKTLIGLMVPGTIETIDDMGNTVITKVSDIENGYYEQSEKLVKMSMVILTSLGTVMIPRNANEISKGNIERFKKNIAGALKFVCLIGIPMAFGMAAIAKNISPWFFGPGYEKVPNLIMMFSPLILIIGLNNVLGLQCLIPLGQDKKYTIAIVSGALVNIALNVLLIYFWWSYGACIATLSAELVVDVILFIYCRKYISFKNLFKDSWRYLLAGAAMFCTLFFGFSFLSPTIWNTLIMVGVGLLVYFVLLIIMWDSTVIKTLKFIGRKLKRNKGRQK